MENPLFASLDGLPAPGSRERVDMRPTLLRVLTDLYVQKLTHTPEEERHYTELALRLLDSVDAATRAVVAARLARHLSPPMRVIQRLAQDGPSGIEPLRAHVLAQEPAESGPHPAPPQPPTADQVATDRGGNGHDRMPSHLIDRDIAQELNEQFFAADATERRLILRNLDIVAPFPAGRIGLMRDGAVGRRLEAAALSRNREEFARELSQALQIARAQACRIVDDNLGEPLITATKALGVPREVAYRILMFVNPVIGCSVARVHGLAALYDEIPAQAAEHMVAIWQALQKEKRTAVHRPLLFDDEDRMRPRTGAAAPPRAVAAPALKTRRNSL